jgi:hypothetical protein
MQSSGNHFGDLCQPSPRPFEELEFRDNLSPSCTFPYYRLRAFPLDIIEMTNTTSSDVRRSILRVVTALTVFYSLREMNSIFTWHSLFGLLASACNLSSFNISNGCAQRAGIA